MRLRPAAIAGTLLLTASVLAVGVPTNAAASAPLCTITGTPGADRLVGTRGNDVICGLGGNDRIFAGGGRDTVYGGAGDDRISGGRWLDVVYGDAGNDRLVGDGSQDRLMGGTGADWLDGGGDLDLVHGGSGADRCRYDDDDVRTSCLFDWRPPTVVSVAVSPTHVDVTERSHVVTITAHLTDDTDIRGAPGPYVDLRTESYEYLHHGQLELVSGTRSDGRWRARVIVARGFRAATLDLSIYGADVSGRPFEYERASALTIADSKPDVEKPKVYLRAPTPTATYDVRSEGQPVTLRARITDNRSGVHPEVTMCVNRRLHDGGVAYPYCGHATRRSGDLYDGVWQTSVRLPKGLRGGDFCVAVMATDRAHPGENETATCGRHRQRYSGGLPDLPFAGGTGEMTVIGSYDNHAPRLVSYSHSPQSTSGPIRFTVRAADAVGVSQVRLGPVRVDQVGTPVVEYRSAVSLRRVSGTAKDGTWEVTLNTGSDWPVGRYYPVIEIYDATHMRTYGGPIAQTVRVDPVLDLPGDPYFEFTPDGP